MPQNGSVNGILQKFKAHRNSAEARGIAFRLTFAEWWRVWEPHWPRRHLDKLCMCRNGDQGDYALGNVYIATTQQNATDWQVNLKLAAMQRGLPAAPLIGLHDTLDEQELRALLDAMKATGCNLSAAARHLGITFRAARHILHKNGMNKADAVTRIASQEKKVLAMELV